MFNPVQLILKKRNGGKHTADEIRWLLKEAVEGRLETYQLSAWLMACWFRGMDDEETDQLTQCMIDSGDTVDLTSIPGVKVDKHSTGGVGDGTTLVIAPIVAAAGGKVAKMSGRGLGHTGGTLDKLESIPGMRVDLSQQEFLDQVNRIGLAVISQTGKLVPADGMLYGLRDVTGTVDSIPLIAASVMSKKLACGADAIVLDVKFGDGAFMKDIDDARKLARAMVAIGRLRGRSVRAALSSMEDPLGRQIGNALEVDEGIRTLRGERKGSALEQVSFELSAHLIEMSKLAGSLAEARQKVEQLVSSGAALDKLRQMIEAQGGNPSVCEDPGLLPQAQRRLTLETTQAGTVVSIEAETVGTAAMLLGAGRQKKSDAIDPGVGVVLEVERGQEVAAGDRLATLHVSDERNLDQVRKMLTEAVRIGSGPVVAEPLIREVIS